MTVREILPARRVKPTRRPKKNWSLHKGDLREDFNSHCAYCGSYDGYRHTYFEVDHFVPKVLFVKTGIIQLCQYDNLVYSCKFCNNNKLSQWPSNDEKVRVVGDAGFIDPCDATYDVHLYRTADGAILWHTNLGRWIATEAFKFDQRMASIKLLWELNQRRKLIAAFVLELTKWPEKSQEYSDIKREAEKISFEYFMFDSELQEYYNSLQDI